MNLSKINADYSNINVNANKIAKYEEAKINKIGNIDEVFNDDEIEEYRQTFLNNPNNKSTTFFFEDSSKSNSEDEGNGDHITKPKIEDLIREKTLKVDMKSLPTEQKSLSQTDNSEYTTDSNTLQNMQVMKEQEEKLISEINVLSKEVEQESGTFDQTESIEDDESIADSQIINQNFEVDASEEDK